MLLLFIDTVLLSLSFSISATAVSVFGQADLKGVPLRPWDRIGFLAKEVDQLTCGMIFSHKGPAHGWLSL
jgi:hypothetical protein